MNGAILSNRSAVDRNKTDFYATPTEVTVALLDFLEDKCLIEWGDFIWEPACGNGAMEEVMRNKYFNVTGTDLYPQIPGRDSVDFLNSNMECDWIITNPPFSKATEFITRALELRKPCAFLLKSQFWHAKSRLNLFREHPRPMCCRWHGDPIFSMAQSLVVQQWSACGPCGYRVITTPCTTPLEKPKGESA